MITVNSFVAFVSSHTDLILTAVMQHLAISLTSIVLGFIVAFTGGIALTYHKEIAKVVLGFFGIVNTIPSLVLLGVAMLVLGLGFVPAVSVLFIYSLLPILRNTYTGICEVDPQYLKAGKGLGMSGMQVLLRVQIPLAMPVIVAGVRLSTVYIISWSTLAAFIGAGGLGDLIWMGLQSYDYNMIFSGAVPATLLALIASFLLSMLEKLLRKRSHQQKGVV